MFFRTGAGNLPQCVTIATIALFLIQTFATSPLRDDAWRQCRKLGEQKTFVDSYVTVRDDLETSSCYARWNASDRSMTSMARSFEGISDVSDRSFVALRGGGRSSPAPMLLACGLPLCSAFMVGSRLPARAAAVKGNPVKKKQGEDEDSLQDADKQWQAQQQSNKLPRWLSWLYRPQRSKAAKLVDPTASVMLQGFDWEEMTWVNRSRLYTTLADNMPKFAEAGINVVWFPPPSSSADEHGYLPGKWYEIPDKQKLVKAIRSAEANGVVSMVDVVLNHRTATQISNATGDWTDFEQPDWQEWAVVNDDWKCAPDQHLKFCPSNCSCGANDTGENACFAPDIDHTNLRVQADIAQWLQWLRQDIGFQAFRFDNTKGYSAKYTEQYITLSNPFMAVGEFFDTNRNLLTAWLTESKESSSTFDFGLRYKLKDSIKQDDFQHLKDEWFGPMLWYAKGNAVTFLDNHDTAGDLNDRFGDETQLAMGYAFLLTHPGVPCIFWQDWFGPLQDTLRSLIAVRNRAHVTSTSDWKVVHARVGLYAGFVGTDLAMKVGSGNWSPNEGLPTRQWEGIASGTGWAVWLRKKEDKSDANLVDG